MDTSYSIRIVIPGLDPKLWIPIAYQRPKGGDWFWYAGGPVKAREAWDGLYLILAPTNRNPVYGRSSEECR